MTYNYIRTEDSTRGGGKRGRRGYKTNHGLCHPQLLGQVFALHRLRAIEEVAYKSPDGARVRRRSERQEEKRVVESCMQVWLAGRVAQR